MEKKDLALEAVKNGISEVIIREGKAKELLPELQIKDVRQLIIQGLGGTCLEFLKYRKGDYFPNTCHAEVNLQIGQIKLYLNECQAYNKHIDIVTSSYAINKKLLDLQLNSGFGRGAKELFTLLRNYKIYAANKEQFQLLLSKLTQFSAKIQAEINKSDDRAGSSNNGIIKKITHEIPENFILNIPIVGNKVASIKIDIELNSNTEQFELWSDEFIEKYNSELTECMQNEFTEIGEFCLVIFI